MTIVINYAQREAPGYVPRKALTLHNVESVHDAGIRMVRVSMMFTDDRPIHDHVTSVVVQPEREE